MIAIHQSQFLPWVPFFSKLLRSDIFVILDHVQFQKNGVQNRNKIKTPQGAQWLTMPVNVHLGDPINTVEVSGISAYARILKALELNYKKSTYFAETYGWMDKVFSKSHVNLHELNTELLMQVLSVFNCQTKIFFSSQLGVSKNKDELVLEIIRKFGEKDYLSGKGALAYMDLDKFVAEGVRVHLSTFEQSPYPQQWMSSEGFIPELSVIDLLFNNLPSAVEYIAGHGRVDKMC